MTKYCSDSSYGNEGFTDTLTVLALEDDVAHVKWGGNWRLPTIEEQKELRGWCIWTWTTVNGVNGYLVTSEVPGYTDRSIFLPAAGYKSDLSFSLDGQDGLYMSSTLSKDIPACTLYLGFNRDDIGMYPWVPRHFGQSVRPVCP